MKKKSIKVTIKGRVQGVFYRVSTREKAMELNLTGWVKNCLNGSVEACFQGDESNVNEMISWCHIGPEMAQVDHVISTPSQEPDYNDFYIT